uniref:Uncharacterized protein n=1 Tax=Megaselia scalaris TaxID=36166 RepID=T1H427_MEGSC
AFAIRGKARYCVTPWTPINAGADLGEFHDPPNSDIRIELVYYELCKSVVSCEIRRFPST